MNWGKPCKLSCAEALAASLFICGWQEDAVDVLSRFKWGHSFFSLNAELLDRYAACQTGAQVIAVQNAFLAQGQRLHRCVGPSGTRSPRGMGGALTRDRSVTLEATDQS